MQMQRRKQKEQTSVNSKPPHAKKAALPEEKQHNTSRRHTETFA